MMPFLIFWGIVFVLLVLAEMGTLQLVSIWFACGSLGAIVMALCGFEFTGQLAVFVAVSFILLLATRPFLRKLKIKNIAQMNAQRAVGAQAVVIEEINAARGTGRARINGVDWIAISETGAVIPKDSIVVISQIDGAKLIVVPD